MIPAFVLTLYAYDNLPDHTWELYFLLGMLSSVFYMMMGIIGLGSLILISLIQVLVPHVNKSFILANYKLRRLMDTPNRLDVIEKNVMSVTSPNTLELKDVKEIKDTLKQILEAYEVFKTKEIGEIFTEIFITLKEHEKKLSNSIPIEEYEILSKKLLEAKEEIKKLKGE